MVWPHQTAIGMSTLLCHVVPFHTVLNDDHTLVKTFHHSTAAVNKADAKVADETNHQVRFYLSNLALCF